MRITACKVNHMENPLGYCMENTVFSWILEEENVSGDGKCSTSGATQAAFGAVESSRLIVKNGTEVVSDTGWADLDSLATALNLKLHPRTRYTWIISVRNKEGVIVSSEEQCFETGKMQEPWQAEWIGCGGVSANDSTEAVDAKRRLPRFEKTFSLANGKSVKAARLYICGLGLYEAELDGQRIGDAYLTPGFTSYNNWVQVQTYDVTAQICACSCDNMEAKCAQMRTHKLSVLLGDGWYKSRVQFESPKDCFYGSDYKLLAELHISYEDGNEAVIGTDESWSLTRSNITFTGIYDGERKDDTLPELPPESAKSIEAPKGELTDSLSLPVRAQEIFEGKLVETAFPETVLDIGQNMAGMFRLRVHVPKGQQVRLQFGEVLQDGHFYRDNLRTAKAEYVYISGGEEHVLQPRFTFYGYRYVKIEGIENFDAKDFTAFAIYSDISMRGQLVTGNEKINRLIQNSIWGMKSNFVDLPTDCPQRDERMGWTGDAQVFCETASLLADTYAFYRKYLYDMRKEQLVHGGAVPTIIPTVANHTNTGVSVWGDAVCIIPWNMYLYSGDKSILQEHYDSMRDWVENIRRIDGEDHGWRKIRHLGDWLALDGPGTSKEKTQGGTDEAFIADVYYRKSTLILAKSANLLGKEEESRQYEQLADSILEGICEEYFSPNGRCCIPTQTAALLTLSEDLNRKDRAVEQLRTCLEDNGDKLTTGFVGTPYLCPMLTAHGLEKKAFKILLNEEYPGWLYEVNLGATTIWERWNSLDETGHITGIGMNSLNHYSYGAITGWIWKDVAGLQVKEDCPGFREVLIRPHVNLKLKSVHAVFPSPAGTYEIAWETPDANHVKLCVKVPYGCKAEVVLPYADSKEPVTVQAGVYETTYETTEPIAVPFSLDDTLKKLMSNVECREVLKREVENIEYLLAMTGVYPLRETMNNLGFEKELMERLEKQLTEILE